MAISKKMKQTLLKEGFIFKEIRDLVNAKGGDVPTNSRVKQQFNWTSRPFQAMRRSRRAFVKRCRDAGWNDLEIRQKVVDWYKNPSNDIFLFLKLEYRKNSPLTDWEQSIRLRSRAKISRVFGRSYGRKMRPTLLPKYLPKRPMLPNKPRLIRKRSYKLGTK